MIKNDLYVSAILSEVEKMKQEGVYVCLGNLLPRMPFCDQQTVSNSFWSLCLQGRI